MFTTPLVQVDGMRGVHAVQERGDVRLSLADGRLHFVHATLMAADAVFASQPVTISCSHDCAIPVHIQCERGCKCLPPRTHQVGVPHEARVS